MRYEAKNNYFKNLSTRHGNFINLPYSLAICHQLLQCYYNLNKEVIGHELEVGFGDTVSADILQNLGICLLNTEIAYRYVSSGSPPPTVFYYSDYSVGVYVYMSYYYYCSTRWVKVEGVEYRRRCVVIIGMDDEDPIFGCVEAIYIIASRVYLHVSAQTIVKYSSHFHAFVIAHTSLVQQKLVEPEQLMSPFPLQMRFVSGLTTHGNIVVVLKHSICVL